MKSEVNIIHVIQKEGIKLKKSGKAYKGLCPFHEDKTPSFYVYPDSNRFICFGCSEKGDAIDFIMKYRNLSFKEAKAYLGIKHTSKKLKSAGMSRREKLLTDFKQWEVNFYDEITTEYRAINWVLENNITTMEKAEQLACLYHRLPVLEYHMDILACGSDEEKYKLKNEVCL